MTNKEFLNLIQNKYPQVSWRIIYNNDDDVFEENKTFVKGVINGTNFTSQFKDTELTYFALDGDSQKMFNEILKLAKSENQIVINMQSRIDQLTELNEKMQESVHNSKYAREIILEAINKKGE